MTSHTQPGQDIRFQTLMGLVADKLDLHANDIIDMNMTHAGGDDVVIEWISQTHMTLDEFNELLRQCDMNEDA